MDMLDNLITELRTLFRYDYKARESLREISQLPQNPTYQEELDIHNEQLDAYNKRIRSKLSEMLQYPPCHMRHYDKRTEFHNHGDYEKSIFIMTKFPDPSGDGPLNIELNRVINAVSDAIKAYGFQPRIASDRDYHKLLWDNVELHLLCCSKGIAIVEDRYKPELNPNVAMEWGWMRAMGKDVLYLVEKDFTHFRADWSGLTQYSFAWDDPANDIQLAIKKWIG